MSISFAKGQHLGNDYIYIDLAANPHLLAKFFSSASSTASENNIGNANDRDIDADLNVTMSVLRPWIVKVSDRRFGIGSDGVIFLAKSSSSSTDEKADDDNGLKMRMFNADGSEADMCGNGLMTLSLLSVFGAGQQHFHRHAEQGSVSIRTNKGLSTALVDEQQGRVSLALATPVFEYSAVPCLPRPMEDVHDVQLFAHQLRGHKANVPLPLLFSVPLPFASSVSKVLQVAHIARTASQREEEERSGNEPRFSLLADANNLFRAQVAGNLHFMIAAVGMGNPHCVLVLQHPGGLDDGAKKKKKKREEEQKQNEEDPFARNLLDSFPIELLADKVKPVFPEGVNVSVAVVYRCRETLSVDASGTFATNTELCISMRTWERGSGPTLACGSGACATVVTAAHLLCDSTKAVAADAADSDNADEQADEEDEAACLATNVDAEVWQPGGYCNIAYSMLPDGSSTACRMVGSPKIAFCGEVAI